DRNVTGVQTCALPIFIPFAIRIKKNSKVKNHHGKLVQIKELLRHVSHQETYRHGRILTVDGCLVRVFAKRDKDYGLVIVATNQLETVDAMTSYAKRWEIRSEEHTSELQSRFDLVCRLLLEKKKSTISEKL